VKNKSISNQSLFGLCETVIRPAERLKAYNKLLWKLKGTRKLSEKFEEEIHFLLKVSNEDELGSKLGLIGAQ